VYRGELGGLKPYYTNYWKPPPHALPMRKCKKMTWILIFHEYYMNILLTTIQAEITNNKRKVKEQK